MGRYERSLLLIGENGLSKLQASHVLLLGVGGVGSFAAESLVRSGIGAITLVDGDVYAESNLNRQLGALPATIGRTKVEVTRERILAINRDTVCHTDDRFLTVDDVATLFTQRYDYVLDAIDDIAVKIALARHCTTHEIPLLTCLGTGNKWDMTKLTVTDLAKTHTDPLAKRLRHDLRAYGIEHLKVVFSPEIPHKVESSEAARRSPGSLPFVPPAAGILMAQTAVHDLLAGD